MIGASSAGASRHAMVGLASVLVLALLLGARPSGAAEADPPREAGRQDHLRALAADADAALDDLGAWLLQARDAARRGSALVVAGEADPAPELERAAASLESAGGNAAAAVEALARLRGAMAGDPAAGSLPLIAAPTGQELASIAGQLRATARAAGPFVERREASETVVEALGEALSALDRDLPREARDHLQRAAAAMDVVAAWDPPPPVLTVWQETTGALLQAAEDIVDAALAGDPAAAEAAGRAYAAAADEARRADIALALAISEEGAGLSVTPLRRLADALDAVAVLRAGVASVLHEVS